ncbi:MAG: hypothetical protein P8O16_13820 [Algoriphagus sp.]|jgi:hypothetical protein|uniref:hypothetical protein n=1 Tax=Algoriphagus sp. TaxID=1872435 RepID=UPI002635E90E|nr:hypothetical protein [Algoriphagus sp.]MDG1278357.1 hypothetical protein [Algoriphagus sp.]
MKLMYPELRSLISGMSDGDDEFENQLTTAIYQGLIELREKYLEASITKNEEIIKQIRHKLKPTLSMFGFDDIIAELHNGKDILDSNGFGVAFEDHKEILFSFLEAAICESRSLIK